MIEPKVVEAPELNTKKLVIGYSLPALQFAMTNGAMLLINGTTTPHPIEEKEKANNWHRLTFNLGMRGLTPIPSEIESIRIEEQTAKVTTEFYRMIKVRFEELYIFDLERVDGLVIEEKVEDYIVYDWFNIKRGAKQAACALHTGRDFVKKLVFYPSVRKDGNDGSFKDCYTKSYIPADRLQEFENCGTVAKFAAMRLIKENGFHGPERRVGDKVHHLNIILEHDRREIHKNKKEFIVGEGVASNIFCCNVSEEWT